MMRLFTFLLLITILPAQAQELKELKLKSSIDNVTIYLQNAQISRSGKISIPKGKSIISINRLSPYIDEKSIQVKGDGDFTILSVNHKLNFLEDLIKNNRLDSLREASEKIESTIIKRKSRIEILHEKQSILNENKKLGGQNVNTSLTEIKNAIEFYDKELTQIKSEEIKINSEIKELESSQNSIAREIQKYSAMENSPSGTIEIKIESKNATTGQFKVNYIVANAGWFPSYDIRSESINQPLKLTYKADVYQNTGVDWKDVKIKLSNGNPQQSGTAPVLNPWHLNYKRFSVLSSYSNGYMNGDISSVSGKVTDQNGEGIPGVNVMVSGSTIGTTTNILGEYSISLPNGRQSLTFSSVGYITQTRPVNSRMLNIVLNEDINELSEVVVTKALSGSAAGVRIRGASSVNANDFIDAESITTTVIENQTTVEFEIDEPYTVKSNSDKISVEVKTYNIDADYEYYAVPKLDRDAFLIARITNWDQYNFLEGEANLYFEGTFVGRSILDAKSLNDTLNISLGRDKSIIIGREKIEDFSKEKIFASNKVDSRYHKILVRNKKSQPVKITLYDQIPVPVINSIEVEPVELSNASLNAINGKVTWELTIPAQQQEELKLAYKVKYPKRESVILE
ncbi:mucoidy inhibitor MuiA family protein [Marinigracilibium pacificum]|uniref:Mucoidy inhibitor MuiA family protein n=1 Tax=Marinigracilibium pacificum TaxID=2729599 RepID=A0A848J3R3_9BACT|nr:mucoidy inhibitor MuiA family protein [Marinigracilibium pacificum]NMM49124.1 mucoidy inhibitor MuiA family protein [Marinigracilibium pacificum]